jgi:mannose-1-phosphate guanylyltransferase
LFKNTKVKRGAYINGSILSWDCTVGEWARIEGPTVIAESVKVKDEVRITQAMIMSQKDIAANVEKGAIVM